MGTGNACILRMNELLLSARTSMDLTNIRLNEKSQAPKSVSILTLHDSTEVQRQANLKAMV